MGLWKSTPSAKSEEGAPGNNVIITVAAFPIPTQTKIALEWTTGLMGCTPPVSRRFFFRFSHAVVLVA